MRILTAVIWSLVLFSTVTKADDPFPYEEHSRPLTAEECARETESYPSSMANLAQSGDKRSVVVQSNDEIQSNLQPLTPTNDIESLESRASRGDDKALADLRVRGENGSLPAQLLLGLLCRWRFRGRVDPTESLKWYTMAARQGSADAQDMLGIIYEEGDEVAQDYIKSYFWYEMAARCNNYAPWAADFQFAREYVAHKMTAEQILQAKQMIEQWQAELTAPVCSRRDLPILKLEDRDRERFFRDRNEHAKRLAERRAEAERKLIAAQKKLVNEIASYRLEDAEIDYSRSKHRGFGRDVFVVIEPQFTLADQIELLDRAESGDDVAQEELGSRYWLGRGLPLDHGEALKWLRKAAEAGNLAALWRLTNLYEVGSREIQKDYAQMWKYITELAQLGSIPAQFKIGELYLNGTGTQQDYRTAANWFRKAADAEFYGAQIELAKLYSEGMGVPQDYREAYFLLALVVSKGSRESEKALHEVAAHLSLPDRLLGQARVLLYKRSPEPTADYFTKSLRKRAEQGNPWAQRQLAFQYDRQGNYAEAYFWYGVAGVRESQKAMVRNITPEEKFAADARLKEWKPPPRPPQSPYATFFALRNLLVQSFK